MCILTTLVNKIGFCSAMITHIQLNKCLSPLQSAQHVVEESRAAEMRGLYSGLSVQGEGCVWVLTSWIKAWLGGSLSPGERGTLEPLLCRHSK